MAPRSVVARTLFLAGRYQEGGGELLRIDNPATGRPVQTLRAASAEDVDVALQAAHAAFKSGTWSRRPAADRARVLQKLATSFAQRIPELAELETAQTGRPIREMRTQLGRLPEWFEYFAALLRSEEGSVQPTAGLQLNYVTRVPLGVCALLSSFNHPLLISIKKLAAALAGGNSVVLKPSELAPLAVLDLGGMASEAGLPDGVLSILPGLGTDVGRCLVSSPLVKKVDLTGGTPAGRALGEIAGRNLAAMTSELGGKAPIIVFGDADIARAAAGVCFASFIASGQTCVAGTRIIVEQSIYPDFLAALEGRAASIAARIGDPMNPKSTMGPLITENQLRRVDAAVATAQNQGCRLLVGGRRLEGPSPLDAFPLSSGSYYAPTVLTWDGTGRPPDLWRDELFAPVILVRPFRAGDEDEATKLANDSAYGLGAGVWTGDAARGMRIADRVDAGICWVNTHHRNDPSSPWGGMKDSGIGRENGKEAYRAYTQTKSVVVNLADAQAARAEDWFRDDGADVRYG